MSSFTLGFSTCPNDTFMFDALVHGRVPTGDFRYEVVMKDIFHLNQHALRGDLDVVKISYSTYADVQDQYQLLDAGSALGFGCGPLLVAREPFPLADLPNKRIAIPGKNTTANLLLTYFAPDATNRMEVIFDEVMPAVIRGEADAGLIIHENRFTYQQHGLVCLQDLGEYWEQQTGLPIPLGAIVAKKSLGAAAISAIETQLRESIVFAFAHREAAMPFVRAHAQEMDDTVMQSHIALYVNDFSLALGEKGAAAVQKLLQVKKEQAAAMG